MSRLLWIVVVLWWLPVDVYRLTVFSDEGRLWREASLAAPWKPRPLLNLANIERLEGRQDVARTHYRRALALAGLRSDPVERQLGLSLAEANLGLLAIDRGDLPMARRCLSKAIEINPKNPQMQAAYVWFMQQYHGADVRQSPDSCS